MNVKTLLVIALLSQIVACGWVDSTGRESNSAPVVQISFADGQRTDAIPVNELSSSPLTVNAVDEDGIVNSYQWGEQPLEEGALDQCAGVADFNIDLAANSLQEACPQPTGSCAVVIEQLDDDINGEVSFMVTTPKLRAPVGVTYQLDAIDNEGGTGTQQSTFCLIAINEAPDARDDNFTVLEGQVLTVKPGTDQLNLLTNDVQDDHVSNNALLVLSTPEVAPTLAKSFTLGNDGSFTYESELLSDRALERDIDTFVYSVTDGTHISQATVTIQVVAQNDPPELSSPIPVQVVTAGVEFESDLSQYFTDPEDSTLSFSISGGALPASGSLTLSPTGILSGTVGLIDVGNYVIDIIASDGSQTATAEVSIVVAENSPVQAGFILPQSNNLGDIFALDISEYFTDPEGAPLTYDASSRSAAVTIELVEETGEMTAEFSNTGRFAFIVSANDGINPPVSISFVVVVTTDNVAPVFTGSISNRIARVGVAITPVVGVFSDANADELTISVEGVLPEGLALSANGALFGIPTEDGTFSGIRLVATDPLGESAKSNAFRIFVRPGVTTPVGNSE